MDFQQTVHPVKAHVMQERPDKAAGLFPSIGLIRHRFAGPGCYAAGLADVGTVHAFGSSAD